MKKSWYLVRTSIVFVVATLLLLGAILAFFIPKVDSAFENFSDNVDRAVAQAYIL